MLNNIDYVKSNIELGSYSSSKYFKGFCLSKAGWGDENYIRLLLNITMLLVDKLQLVSSLNIGIDLERHAQEYSIADDDLDCRNALVNDGIITNTLGEVSSDKFHYSKDIDENTAIKVIRYQTSVGGAFGHLFFVDSENDIIVYPHDDCGLGFVILGSIEIQRQKLSLLEDVEQKYKDIMSFEFWNKKNEGVTH